MIRWIILAAMLIATPAAAITDEQASKLNAYGVIAPCQDDAAQCAGKVNSYAVVAPITDSSVATKINTYAIVQPCSVTPTDPACVARGGFFRGFP